jgi:predicted nucleotidyltransferase
MKVELDIDKVTDGLCNEKIINESLKNVVSKLSSSSSSALKDVVVCAILYGSVAKRSNGIYSDIDIFLLLRDSTTLDNKQIRGYLTDMLRECNCRVDVDFHFARYSDMRSCEGIYYNIVKEGIIVWQVI